MPPNYTFVFILASCDDSFLPLHLWLMYCYQANIYSREGRVMIFNLFEAAQEFLFEIAPAHVSVSTVSFHIASDRLYNNFFYFVFIVRHSEIRDASFALNLFHWSLASCIHDIILLFHLLLFDHIWDFILSVVVGFFLGFELNYWWRCGS